MYTCEYAHIQGIVREGFSGVNNCTVMKVADGAEYSPDVQRGVAPSTKAPVVSSQSMRCGDLFTVIQVGTVGQTPAELSQDNPFMDARAGVLHAALVLVHPGNGSGVRFEVLTGEQLNPLVGQVQFHRSGLPPMELKVVRLQCPLPLQLCSECMLPPMHTCHVLWALIGCVGVCIVSEMVMKLTYVVMKCTMVVMNSLCQ